MAIEIVDCPIKNGDVPSFFVSLPGRVFYINTQLREPVELVNRATCF